MTLVVGLLLLVAIAMVLAVLVAGTAAERAVRLARVGRRSDHWRRVGEAAQDVEMAAVAYGRLMLGGPGDVPSAVVRYQEACARLTRVLAAGPRPPRCDAALAMLLDPRGPETVAAARPAETILARVADLQDSLDAEAFRIERGDPIWSIRARVRLAIIALRGHLRALSRG